MFITELRAAKYVAGEEDENGQRPTSVWMVRKNGKISYEAYWRKLTPDDQKDLEDARLLMITLCPTIYGKKWLTDYQERQLALGLARDCE